jgi:hypothetical protein
LKPGVKVDTSTAPWMKDETLINYVETSSAEIYGDAIAYFGFSYYWDEGALLYGVPIKNDVTNTYVAPFRANLLDDSYVPFGRRLYMQLYNNDASLANTKPFLRYGLSNAGMSIASRAGMLPLPYDQRATQLATLGLTLPIEQVIELPFYPAAPAPEDDFLLPANNCGFFKLNLFCLTGCGLIGRILRLCKYT